ncbi:hypothetical protein HYU22_01175 [Candidatus Woesearchaeota archaeon]|nr:hypothetical protein [Candidatus Woesearchaeota archaeon]
MNLQDLVQLVASNTSYLGLNAPRDERVLRALRAVDRQKFIPAGHELTPSLISTEEIGHLRQTIQNLEVESEQYTEFNPPPTEKVMEFIKNLFEAAEPVASSAWTLHLDARELAYQDIPLVIGHEQTCSQPSMVAFMCDILSLEPGMRVLEIGTGCGYHAAVTSEILGAAGHLVSIERLPRLAELGWKNLQEHFNGQLEQRITLLEGDGSFGIYNLGPFDRIYFTAAVNEETFNPTPFARQLALSGVLLYPQQQGSMVRRKYDLGKLEDTQVYKNVCFVPLQGKNGGME